MSTVKIGDRLVGLGHPCFVIAEIGINHNGSLELAKKLIDMAVVAGCDAVKFQKRTVDVVYTPEELAKPRENTFGPTNGDLKRGLEFGEKEYDEIDSYCREKNISWSASPWDEQSVDFLEKYNPPYYKIASACNGDSNLMKYIKSKSRQIIVSIGMTNDAMVDRIVDLLGEKDLIIMHCTATYPSKDSELHLSNIPRLIEKYPRAVIGYSGHEVGVYPTLVAAALGACIIERHISLDRTMWGSDQAASLEITGLNRLMKELKVLIDYRGRNVKTILESEKPVATKLRRIKTLFADMDIT